ncbi:MAG: hypothetical protein WCA35_03655 [Kovacikia sp.]
MRIPVKLPRLQGGFKIFAPFLCALLLVLWVQRSPVVAQSTPINQATITEVLDSSQVFIQNKQAKVKDSANKGQRVRTAEARAQLKFNTGAVGRLAHNSVLTVGQCARLRQGTLLVNGAMNGCTSSVIAGVRGTTYLLEVNETGEANIKVLEGTVTVTRSSTPENGEESVEEPGSGVKQNDAADELILAAGEKISVSSSGKPGLVEKLSQADFINILKGSLFDGFTTSLPGISKIQQSFQNLFPGVPFPIEFPGIPSVPTPPVRVPLPF